MLRQFWLNGQPVSVELVQKPVKNLNLRIHSNGRITLSVPKGTPTSRIRTFLTQNAGFVLKTLQKNQGKICLVPPGAYKNSPVYYHGLAKEIRLCAGKPGVCLQENAVLIFLASPDAPEAARQADLLLRSFWKKTAQQEFTRFCRLHFSTFARKGLAFPSLSFRFMTSRYGSCQPKTGKITLNLFLLCVEPAAAEAVVVHELCHLLHPDHSAAFYRQVEELLPDYRQRRHLLDRYRLEK